MPGSRSYRDMLENAVAANGIIKLTTTQGNQLEFKVVEGDQRSSNQLLLQNRPAITILWLGEGDDGLVPG